MMKIIQNWGFIKYCQIEFQNPFANLIYKWRHKKAARKWFNDRKYIVDTYCSNSESGNYIFKWFQLVEQEIFMWIKIGKQVELDDFDCICKTRGFYPEQIEYLRDMMKYVELGKNL